MSDKSAIEWTDATWNPTYGCTKIGPECAHCYITRTPPYRIAGLMFDRKGHIPIQLHHDRLEKPKTWSEPRMIFVDSLSDLFHPDVPDEFIFRVYQTMAHTPRHTYQVLTKRVERMAALVPKIREKLPDRLDHVWHGATVGNQPMANLRIPWLLKVPSRIRFLSCEPLLGPVDLSPWLMCEGCRHSWRWHTAGDMCQGTAEGIECHCCMMREPLLDWVIVGGESGPRHRTIRPEWVRSIRDACVAASVPFLFKQWGGATPKSGGRLLDGRTWDEFPR